MSLPDVDLVSRCAELAAAAAGSAADMRLAPASSNPFAGHPLPMQEGRRLLAEGRVGDASLAFEAAAQVRKSRSPAGNRRLFVNVSTVTTSPLHHASTRRLTIARSSRSCTCTALTDSSTARSGGPVSQLPGPVTASSPGMELALCLLAASVVCELASCSQAAPDNWEAFWELSQARFELGDAAGGLLPLDRASALAPGNDEVALTLAEVRRHAARCASESVAREKERARCSATAMVRSCVPHGCKLGLVQHVFIAPQVFMA